MAAALPQFFGAARHPCFEVSGYNGPVLNTDYGSTQLQRTLFGVKPGGPTSVSKTYAKCPTEGFNKLRTLIDYLLNKSTNSK